MAITANAQYLINLLHFDEKAEDHCDKIFNVNQSTGETAFGRNQKILEA